jgi:hypothetical protein
MCPYVFFYPSRFPVGYRKVFAYLNANVVKEMEFANNVCLFLFYEGDATKIEGALMHPLVFGQLSTMIPPGWFSRIPPAVAIVFVSSYPFTINFFFPIYISYYVSKSIKLRKPIRYLMRNFIITANEFC